MHARLPAESLRDALAPVKALVNEAVLHPTRDELTLHALDPSKTASVTVTLPSSAFDTYTSNDTTLGINVQRPTELLWYFSPSGPLTITTPPSTDRFQLETEETGSSYSTPSLDPSTVLQRDQPTTNRELATVFSIPSNSTLFERSLTAADLCTETISIRTRQSTPELILTAAGDNDEMCAEFTRNDLPAYYGSTTSESYPLDKLTSMYEVLHGRTERLHVAINTDGTLFLNATHTATGTTTRYVLSADATKTDDQSDD